MPKLPAPVVTIDVPSGSFADPATPRALSSLVSQLTRAFAKFTQTSTPVDRVLLYSPGGLVFAITVDDSGVVTAARV